MNIDVFLNNFIPSLFATIVGGGILTFLIFFLREKFFYLPDISGRWYFTTRTMSSAYNPYKDMELEYVAFLYKEGNKIYGSSEKIYEISSTGEREYVGVNRRKGKLTGYIEKQYFSVDKVLIHSNEEEFSRGSSNFYSLEVLSDEKMTGHFASMVADQTGEVFWSREPILNRS